jgi:hypothetical protein
LISKSLPGPQFAQPRLRVDDGACVTYCPTLHVLQPVQDAALAVDVNSPIVSRREGQGCQLPERDKAGALPQPWETSRCWCLPERHGVHVLSKVREPWRTTRSPALHDVQSSHCRALAATENFPVNSMGTAQRLSQYKGASVYGPKHGRYTPSGHAEQIRFEDGVPGACTYCPGEQSCIVTHATEPLTAHLPV